MSKPPILDYIAEKGLEEVYIRYLICILPTNVCEKGLNNYNCHHMWCDDQSQSVIFNESMHYLQLVWTMQTECV